MRLHLPWLEESVELPPTDELARTFAAAGIEVEHIDDPRARCAGVLAARITEVMPHPSSGKLHVCQVDAGDGLHQVVCGAPDVRVGMQVAYAPVGARLGEVQLAARELRGVMSHGMLCSRPELGLVADGDGLFELPEDIAVGSDVVLACNFPQVWTLGITPNRSDLLGHQGLAREVAASTQKRLKAAKWRLIEKGPEISTLARALVDEPAGCRRYVARVVHHVQVGPSPLWLRERLAAMGQRSINNVVDVTNYVMFELNQPLHAFDLGTLAVHQGVPTVKVRRAQEGEALATLDGVARTLSVDDLVVADASGPLALAGVMGGKRSEVTATTRQVLLEAACFDPVWVRRSARRHGLRSESSYRFERGTDVGALNRAVDRCAQLLGEVATGEAAKGTLDVREKSDGPQEITLRLPRIARVLGLQVTAEQTVSLLEPLEIRCVRRTENALVFAVPTFRNDISREIDLIEEVARRYGYTKLPERLPDPSGGLNFRPPVLRLGEKAREALLAQGLGECVTFAFAARAALQPWSVAHGEPVALLNPLGEQQAVLRTTLLPGLLQVLQHNMRHGQKGGAFFEVGHVFWQNKTEASETSASAGERSPAATGGVDAAASAGHTVAQASAGDAASFTSAGSAGPLEVAGRNTSSTSAGHAGPSSSLGGADASAIARMAAAPAAGQGASQASQASSTSAAASAPVLSAAERIAACNAVLPHEEAHVGLVLAGPRHAGRWYEAGETFTMADAKGAVESLLEAYDVAGELSFAAANVEALNPYASASICLDNGAGPQVVGCLGQLEPSFQASAQVVGDVFVAELALGPLDAAPRRVVAAQTLPKFPPTRRDVALVGPKSLHAEDVRRFLADHAGGELGSAVVAEVRLFDVYTGSHVGSDEVSLAFAITYQSRERTLVDSEVNDAFRALLRATVQKFGVVIRDGAAA